MAGLPRFRAGQLSLKAPPGDLTVSSGSRGRDGMTEVTEILQDVKAGRPGATDALVAALYQELRVLARRDLAEERAGHTLQPTALVHEVWMRLFGTDAAQGAFENRAHFFSAASTALRRVLVDHARRR